MIAIAVVRGGGCRFAIHIKYHRVLFFGIKVGRLIYPGIQYNIVLGGNLYVLNIYCAIYFQVGSNAFAGIKRTVIGQRDPLCNRGGIIVAKTMFCQFARRRNLVLMCTFLCNRRK